MCLDVQWIGEMKEGGRRRGGKGREGEGGRVA